MSTEKTKMNSRMNHAKSGKNDEFYTQITDIEKELGHYKHHFKGKVVFCNCDDPEESNFWRYFSLNFEHLGLKKLIATHYETDKPSYKLEISADINQDGKLDGLDTVRTPLSQNGDFRSDECVAIMKEADIVVTNPPFSLFREYIELLLKYDKKFLVIGNQNAITYKEIFGVIKDNGIWTGVDNGGTKWFQVPDHYEIKTQSRIRVIDGIRYFSMGSIYWFTNLEHNKRHEKITLYKRYEGNEAEYPSYDNYDAIEVRRVAEIPEDYPGVMGVPITFIDKYCPEQFQILGSQRWAKSEELEKVYRGQKNSVHEDMKTLINGKETYDRIFIRNRNPV